MRPAKVKLTLDQEQALMHLDDGKKNIFLTGGAGTGKSFLIRHFLSSQTKAIPILASTGAAAILVGGRTFHSFFGLGILQGGHQAAFERAVTNKRLKKRLRDTNTLIIDEISMLSWDVLDLAESIARALRLSDEPWGGIRIIAVGDFSQLPPVSRGPLFDGPGDLGFWKTDRGTQKPWAFFGEAWARSAFKIMHLKEVMRTGDRDFLRVLDDIRVGAVSERVLSFLKKQSREYVDTDVTHLFPRRKQTEYFNRARLSEIESDSKSYETFYGGDQRYFEFLQREAPVPTILELKKGALVMVRVNDPKQRYVNGTIGRITALKEELIEIDVEGRRFEIEKFAFGVMDADGNEVAFAKNFPVSLAYASTIHKIQGATVDRLHVDLTGLWEPGQAYVALSRVRRGKDVTVGNWTEASIKADPIVMSFYSGESPKKESFEDLL
jgi:ATP-dependent exoDNAse (exonuclease V) alpha subunit